MTGLTGREELGDCTRLISNVTEEAIHISQNGSFWGIIVAVQDPALVVPSGRVAVGGTQTLAGIRPLAS